MGVLIRKAIQADIPALNNLLRQVLEVHHAGRPDLFKGEGKKYTDKQLEELLQEKDMTIFIAESDGLVCGEVFCTIKQTIGENALHDCKTLYIEDVCVDKSVRGKKIGTLLFDYVKRFAKEQGCYNMTLNVWAFNESAAKFYEKMGFKPQKTHVEHIL